jgi:hypothetical protein
MSEPTPPTFPPGCTRIVQLEGVPTNQTEEGYVTFGEYTELTWYPPELDRSCAPNPDRLVRVCYVAINKHGELLDWSNYKIEAEYSLGTWNDEDPDAHIPPHAPGLMHF